MGAKLFSKKRNIIFYFISNLVKIVQPSIPYFRFKLSSITEPVNDLVYGPVVHDVFQFEGDPIILKSDGFPTYHLANVIDDHLMGIR